jgi:hypothetical protein
MKAAILSGVNFDPRTIPSVKLWLDASRITGLVDGDPVGTWSDLSGNGFDLAQATGSKKPTYKTGIQNGRPVVRFDGVDDALTRASRFVTSGNFTVLIAFKSTAANSRLLLQGTGASSSFIGVFTASQKLSVLADGTTIATGSATLSTSSWYTVSLVYDAAASPKTVAYVNGTQDLTQNLSANYTGDKTALGANVTESSFLTGDVGEVIICTTALSAADRQRAENYLRSRWATG